jgi:thioredoxin reductase
VETGAERIGRNALTDRTYDVVVIGGGAAGLAGAVGLARARRSVLVVDAGRPRIAAAGHVHNFLSRDSVPPDELLAMGRAEVARYGGEVIAGQAEAASRDGDGFVVALDGNIRVRARRLLVTTGLTDELPDVPGLAERWGRDVLHCPHCHGWEARDRRIGVLATGPTGARQALTWRQWSPHVTLLIHDAAAPDPAEAERLAARGISIVDGPVATFVVSGDALTGLRLASGELVEVEIAVVAPRFRARAALLQSLGLEPVDGDLSGLTGSNQIPSDPTGATAVPGVWVAGNVTHVLAQVVTAAATGLNAAVAINADLVAEDIRIAVDAYRLRGTGEGTG